MPSQHSLQQVSVRAPLQDKRRLIKPSRPTAALRAIFDEKAFNDTFADCSPLSPTFLEADWPYRSEEDQGDEGATLNYVITLFLLAAVTAICGFGAPAGTFALVAKGLAVLFLTLFAAGLVYGLFSERRRVPPSR